jgi:hypothetical protein
MDKFIRFLDQLNNDSNKTLIDSIKDGYLISEGIGDINILNERESILESHSISDYSVNYYYDTLRIPIWDITKSKSFKIESPNSDLYKYLHGVK